MKKKLLIILVLMSGVVSCNKETTTNTTLTIDNSKTENNINNHTEIKQFSVSLPQGKTYTFIEALKELNLFSESDVSDIDFELPKNTTNDIIEINNISKTIKPLKTGEITLNLMKKKVISYQINFKVK